MANFDPNTKELSIDDRINQASILLYRAIAVSDLLFLTGCEDDANYRKDTIAGIADTFDYLLRSAKDLIDGIDQRIMKGNIEVNHGKE